MVIKDNEATAARVNTLPLPPDSQTLKTGFENLIPRSPRSTTRLLTEQKGWEREKEKQKSKEKKEMEDGRYREWRKRKRDKWHIFIY